MTDYSKEFFDVITMNDWLRNLFKSAQKIGNKTIREIEQYVGNKDRNVVSEFERLRRKGQGTEVTHRLWRRLSNGFKKVHEHKK